MYSCWFAGMCFLCFSSDSGEWFILQQPSSEIILKIWKYQVHAVCIYKSCFPKYKNAPKWLNENNEQETTTVEQKRLNKNKGAKTKTAEWLQTKTHLTAFLLAAGAADEAAAHRAGWGASPLGCRSLAPLMTVKTSIKTIKHQQQMFSVTYNINEQSHPPSSFHFPPPPLSTCSPSFSTHPPLPTPLYLPL